MRVWNNIVQKQMYVTGGIGSSCAGEAFSVDYNLPNDIAYSETCAAIALMGYELGLFAIGLFEELTLWKHLSAFVLTGLYSCATLLAYYPLIYKIGLIGGNTWKE